MPIKLIKKKKKKKKTDACDLGTGAVLSQLDENSEEHPVAYASRKLLPRETRYSIIEKDCLPIGL